jgi:hypothetical protein
MRRTVRHSISRPALAIPLTLVLGVLGACAGNPGDPGSPSTQQLPLDSVVLAPGQQVQVDLLRLSFQEVTDDSRCPVDVVCIWQGSAAVHITLAFGNGPGSSFALYAGDGARPVVFGRYRVTLLGLAPVPYSAVRIEPGAYRAAFRVEATD